MSDKRDATPATAANKGKRKFSTDFNPNSSSKLNIGGNWASWIEKCQIKCRIEYGQLADELTDPDWNMNEDYPMEPSFEFPEGYEISPIDSIKIKSALDAWERRKEKIDENNKKIDESRAKIVGILIADINKELHSKCEHSRKNFSREIDGLYSIAKFICDQSVQHTAVLDLSVLCDKITNKISNLRQGSNTLFEYLEKVKLVIDENNSIVTSNEFDVFLSLTEIKDQKGSKLFIHGLNPAVYGELQTSIKSAAALDLKDYPSTLDEAYQKVLKWASIKGINPCQRPKADRFVSKSLTDSTEINMITTVGAKKDKSKTSTKENKNPNTTAASGSKKSDEKKTPRSEKDCFLCGPGNKHAWRDCPNATMLLKIKDLGIKSADEICKQSASVKGGKNVNFYAAANEESDDEDTYNIANPLVDEGDEEISLASTKRELAEKLRSGELVGLDTLSTITIVNNPKLIDIDSISEENTMTIVSIHGTSTTNQKAIPIWGGKAVSYSPGALATILAEQQILESFPHRLITHDKANDTSPKLIGYDIEFKSGNFVKFRRIAGCMVCYAKDIIDACENLVCCASLPAETANPKNTNVFQIMTKSNFKAAERVHQIEDGLGVSPKNLQDLLRGGFWKNTGVTTNDVSRAANLRDIMGHIKNGEYHKAHMNLKPKKPINLKDELFNNQVTAVVDLIFIRGLTYVLAIVVPGSYTWLAYMGVTQHDECKTMGALRPKLIAFASYVYKAGFILKNIASDPESAVAALFKDDPNLLGLNTKFVQMSKGYHDGLFENRVMNLEKKVKYLSSKFEKSVGFNGIVIGILKGIVILACFLLNILPTATNINNAPPQFVWDGGRAIDHKLIFGRTNGLQICEVSTEDSPKGYRTVTAVSLHPTNLTGTWKFFKLDTGECITREHFAVTNWTAADKDVLHKHFSHEREFYQRAKADETLKLEKKANDKAFKAAQKSMLERERDEKRQQKLLIRNAPKSPPKQRKSISKGLIPERPTKNKDGTIFNIPDQARITLENEFAFATQMSFKKGYAKHGDIAREAMFKELKGIDDRGVWTPVDYYSLSTRQKQKIVMGLSIIAEKYKLNEEDLLDLVLKGRLCADGRREDISMFMEGDLAAPTAKTLSVFAMLAAAGAKELKMMTFDINQAFLNADIENEIYVKLDASQTEILCEIRPEYTKFLNKKQEITLRLLKALYGTREAARLWYEHFKEIILSYGYKVSEFDKCVFHKISGEDTSVIILHVDDGLVLSNDIKILHDLRDKIDATFHGKFTWAIDEPLMSYLGMDIKKKDKCVELTMEKFISDLLKDFNVTKIKRVPANSDLFDIDLESPLLSDPERKLFHNGVARTLYLACRVRPDILCSVIFLCRRVKKPTIQDHFKFVNVLKYLKKTDKLGLQLGGDGNGVLHLGVYADAAHAVNQPKMESQTGIYITLGRGAIIANSKKQNYVARASFDAEIYALSDGVPSGIWLQDFMTEVGYGTDVNPGIIYEDNMSVLHSIKKGETTSAQQRHIRIRTMFSNQFTDGERFEITHCPTSDMIADILTKPLQGAAFERLRDLILGYYYSKK